MSIPRDVADLHRRLRVIGSALLRVNFNNTHSGNMSCRDPHDPDRFWVTATGSPCGNLSLHDIVPVRFSDMSWGGAARPSSEANTHRRVLSLPGVNACVHCHSIAATLVGFDAPQNPLFLQRRDPAGAEPKDYLFQPVDLWGAGLIAPVTVGVIKAGSARPRWRSGFPATCGRILSPSSWATGRLPGAAASRNACIT